MTHASETERQRAFRALLRSPLLPAAGDTAEEYNLVRRHSAWLNEWLRKFPAWTLDIHKEAARLRKVPPDLLDETRPAVDRASGTWFSRRRYAFLCLALAALERSDAQTTIEQIAQGVVEFATMDRALAEAGVEFDIGNYDHRRDLVHAVRLLVDRGVLNRVHGDEAEFLNRNRTSCRAETLYDINRPILALILNVSRSASTMEVMQQTMTESFTQRVSRLIDDPKAETEDARSRQIRTRLVRALLDDPILYFQDLNDEERIYLEQHRGYLLRQVCEATGLLAEVRREGIALVDDQGSLTDIQMAEDGTDRQLSSLLVRWFAECFRSCAGAVTPLPEIEEYVRRAGAEPRLIEDELLRLRGLRLIRLAEGGAIPLAACGRYRAEE